MEKNPAVVKALLDHLPPSVEAGFRAFGANDRHPLTPVDRAALVAAALLTLLACAGTVIPIYLLGRAALPAPAAWCAAVLWPLAPAANLFQPLADTAYPFLSTLAIAALAWAGRLQKGAMSPRLASILLAVTGGLLMAWGMAFTIAFLPVGLMGALVIAFQISVGWRMRLALIMATGLGFLTLVLLGWAITAANPFVIGAWNLHHHARFYLEFPRTYHLWLGANLVELAVAIGLPSAVWCVVGAFRPRRVPVPFWSTLLVLLLVDLTGRNLGEIARLWMFFMPPLLLAAGTAFQQLEPEKSPLALGGSILLLGLQTLGLEAMIQVVYPV
jgi:hypothetical protein